MSVIQTIIQFAIPLITLFLGIFWKKLSGYKTQILGAIAVLTGFLTSIDPNIVPFIASLLHVSAESVQGLIVSIMGVLTIIFRKFTDTPAGDLLKLPSIFNK